MSEQSDKWVKKLYRQWQRGRIDKFQFYGRVFDMVDDRTMTLRRISELVPIDYDVIRMRRQQFLKMR
jgi:hypothetical protein